MDKETEVAVYVSQQLIKVAENKPLALKNEATMITSTKSRYWDHTNWKHQFEMRDLKCKSKRLEIKALKH